MPAFAAPYAPPDEELAPALLAAASRGEDAEVRIDARARRLVESIRSRAGGLGGIEDFLHAYSLSTKEGLALMVLAEALLRVPDAVTADRLIEDKLAAGDWSQAEGSGAFLVSASAWTLGITARVIHPGETPDGIVDSIVQAARPADRAARDPPGDAAARLAFRARPDHRGGAVARRIAPRVPLFVRHAGRGRAHRGRRRRAISRPTPTPSTRSARAPATPRCRRGRAFPSSSRRCIRATRRCRASACWRELTPRVLELARQAKRARSQLHRRCRGGRPARTVAGGHRQGAGRSVARRLGRLRPRRAGLSEARRRGDRLARRCRACARPPADGAAGQGRLLGHRGQARAGARACRLSGVHAEADDRSVLHGLHAATAAGAAAGSIRNSPPTTR